VKKGGKKMEEEKFEAIAAFTDIDGMLDHVKGIFKSRFDKAFIHLERKEIPEFVDAVSQMNFSGLSSLFMTQAKGDSSIYRLLVKTYCLEAEVNLMTRWKLLVGQKKEE